MKKLLFITNISKGASSFSMAAILAAKKIGVEFHLAGNFSKVDKSKLIEDEKKYGIKIHQVDFNRSPFSLQNRKAYKQLKKIMKEESFDVVHCNTPIGGFLGRIVSQECHIKKVIYQVHGFHFYKGAPIKNWLFYYPIEKWLAKKTDLLITINREDYEFSSRKLKLRKNGKVMFVPGVGIDLSKYSQNIANRAAKRKELGLLADEVLIISTGDLIKRKNYHISIKAISKINYNRILYIICGDGPQKKRLHNEIIKNHLQDKVVLLGYRNDINDLLNAADIYLFSSKQEGVARSLMEAMAIGLPCVVSKIRGNTDLVENEKGGFLCNTNDINDYASKIEMLCYNRESRICKGLFNMNKITEYDINRVVQCLESIYNEIFNI